MCNSPSRWERPRRRATKWRQHCSTCGVTFPGPQVWGYCSKLCEVSRDGTEDPGDLAPAVIEEMIQLGLAMELAPMRDKQIYQDCINNIERSSARDTFHPEKTISRDDPRFWEYIMDKQIEKYERMHRRMNQETLRTLRRMSEFERVTGDCMGEAFPSIMESMGVTPEEVRNITSSGAMEKYLDSLPASLEFWVHLADHSDDEIETLVTTGQVTPSSRLGSF